MGHSPKAKSVKVLREEGKVTMTFPQAIAEVIKGNRITKLEWDNEDYGTLEGEWLMIYRDGKGYRWTLNDGDLMGDDWVVVK